MNSFMKVVSATVLLAGTGLATTASADVSTLTCGEFANQTDVERRASGHDILLWIADTKNFEAATPLAKYFAPTTNLDVSDTDPLKNAPDAGWSDNEMKIEIEAHCINMPADTNVMKRLVDHT